MSTIILYYIFQKNTKWSRAMMCIHTNANLTADEVLNELSKK